MPSEELIAKMMKFNEQLVKAGVMLDGQGLTPTSKAKRVRFSGFQRTIIDGPFAESKEIIAGYWKTSERKLRQEPDAARTYLLDGHAPKTGIVFKNPNLARRVGESAGQRG